MHAGEVEGGHCVGHGKTEAYFFPPLDVPPYNLTLGSSSSSSGGGSSGSSSSVKTRLGLRPDVERKEVSRVLCTALSSPSLSLCSLCQQMARAAVAVLIVIGGCGNKCMQYGGHGHGHS